MQFGECALLKMVWNPYTPSMGAMGRVAICLLALIAVACIAAIDRLGDADYSLSLFYLIPVGITTWYVGRRTGTVFSLISTFAVTLEQARYSVRQIYSAPVVYQGFAHLGFMLTFVWLLDALRAALEKQERLASVDALTGVMNRRAFIDRLNYVLRLTARENIPISLAYIDIDDFKQINDRRGHDAGDRILRNVANVFAHSVRSSDVVARLGGDEFAILLPDTNSEQAQHIGYKLWHALAGAANDERTPVRCSVGCITFLDPPHNAESAISAGDALMYQAKRSGKNQISFEERR